MYMHAPHQDANLSNRLVPYNPNGEDLNYWVKGVGRQVKINVKKTFSNRKNKKLPSSETLCLGNY